MDFRCICTKAGLGAVLLAGSLLSTQAAFAGDPCAVPEPGAGNCAVPTPGIPGCTNMECCTMVCAVDDFCCLTEWDEFCVKQAQVLCFGGGGIDTCATATVASVGPNPFTTLANDTDGPLHDACPLDDIVHNDLWFTFTATSTGVIAFSTCSDDPDQYDTAIAVYRTNDCGLVGDATLAACADNQAGCAGGTVARTTATTGEQFLIRVGGSTEEDFGSATLTIAPASPAGSVFPNCAAAGSCTTPGAQAGCSDTACCNIVCSGDLFCCTVEWDQACVDAANIVCTLGCSVSTAGATGEGHACGVLGAADPNGGCNVTPAVFTPLTLGTPRSGQIGTIVSATGAPTRDLDWYQMTIPASADTDGDDLVQVRLTLQTEFIGGMFFFGGDCESLAALTPINSDAQCGTATLTAEVDVTTDVQVIVVVTTITPAQGQWFDGVPCGFGGNDYRLLATIIDPVVDFCGVASDNPDCESATAVDAPGCQDADCCNIVCGIDPFCCQAEWDAACAAESIFCATCQISLAGATADGEACGVSTVNGGCNATPSVFTTITSGQLRSGNVFTFTTPEGAATRDTDWMRITVPAGLDVDGDGLVFIDYRVTSEAPVTMLFSSLPGGACPATILAVNDSALCEEDRIFGFVAPGEYIAFVAPGTAAAGIFTGIECQAVAGGGGLGNDYTAMVNLVDNPLPPANDDCASAIPISDGDTDFSTVGATTEAATPALPPECDKVGDMGDLGSDIWYTYTASCTGDLTISLCDGTDYDARMAVYGPGASCAALGAPVACADDSCGGLGSPPTTTFAVTMGQTYLVRIGGFSTAVGMAGAVGDGTINIECGDAPPDCPNPACPSDLNGDTFVNGIDLGFLLGNWSIPTTALGCDGATPCCADLNGDTFVNGIDLGILLGNWSIPPSAPGCAPG